METSAYFSNMAAFQTGVPVFYATGQRQIWTRLRSMMSLRCIRISGYPMDSAVVENMSFAGQLESALVRIPIRASFLNEQRVNAALVAQAKDWILRNPLGWEYLINEGAYSTLDLNFRKVTLKVSLEPASTWSDSVMIFYGNDDGNMKWIGWRAKVETKRTLCLLLFFHTLPIHCFTQKISPRVVCHWICVGDQHGPPRVTSVTGHLTNDLQCSRPFHQSGLLAKIINPL